MNVEYTRISDVLVMLTKDLHYCFKLSDLFKGKELRAVMAKTGYQADEVFVITAPAGFVCDLASVPKALQPLFAPDGKWAAAAVIHDLLYQNTHKGIYPNTPLGKLNAHIDKDFADKIFFNAMIMCDVNIIIRSMFYNAVKYFGEAAYENQNKSIKYPEDAEKVVVNDEPYLFIRELFRPGIPDQIREQHSDVSPVWFKFPNLKRPLINYIKEVQDVQAKRETTITS